MMEKVSNAGNGFYSVISNHDQAVEYATNDLLNTANLIAKDVKIQVQFNPEHVEAYRLLGYENRLLSDEAFKDDSVDAGEIGSGHTVTALYELVLKGQDIPQPEGAPAPWALETTLEEVPSISSMVQVRVRYKDVYDDPHAPAKEITHDLRSAEILGRLDQGSRDLQWSAAIAAFAEILKEGPFGSIENLPIIEGLVEENSQGDSDRMEFLGLFKTAKTLLTK
jgi:Ca-activated chloride channel family protein